MSQTDLLILNFEEIRRRSIIVWRGIPNDQLNWRPDEKAMSCGEMIRHALSAEYIYQQIIENRGSVANPENPYAAREFTTVEDELDFSKPYRENFLALVKSFSKEDLATITIDRSEIGYIRFLGDFLLRIAYHESVHTGQLLDYMRSMGVDRPNIWD